MPTSTNESDDDVPWVDLDAARGSPLGGEEAEARERSVGRGAAHFMLVLVVATAVATGVGAAVGTPFGGFLFGVSSGFVAGLAGGVLGWFL